MQAIVYETYGGREVMSLQEVPPPDTPGAADLRVRVHAASVNPVDGKVRRGELKLIAGGHFPKTPGLDFSGVVEAVGDDVSGFAVGDAVYGGSRGMSEGAFAEHILVHAASIALKPQSLDHTTAAGVPTVAIAALQVLRDMIHVSSGDRILINGATGGVGLFATQIAKHFGAHVTAVCGTDGVALAREMGADEVIDYRKGPVQHPEAAYRAILELSGKMPFEAAESALQEDGLYVDFSPTPASLIGNTLANPFRHHKHVFAMTSAKTADLEWLGELIDSGKLRPAPTEVLPLDQFAKAFALAESGGILGKVVVRITEQ